MKTPQAVVAGHICLDILPAMGDIRCAPEELLVPGKLVNVGPPLLATGGAVSNTGVAMHRLGVPVRLVGKVGNDLFGHAVLELLNRAGAGLADGMVVADGEHTSYTVVINPPEIDRIFLHCPGANDTFRAADVTTTAVRGARLFHFGYPPLMRRMFLDEGRELVEMLARVRSLGPAVSLDLSLPDPASEAGRVEWQTVLEKALPHVDVFLPSLDEILFMLDRPRWEQMRRAGEILPQVDDKLLSELADRLIAMGAAVVGLKLGEQGLYLRTAGDAGRIRAAKLLARESAWRERELLAPCLEVRVAGTTGAGDCTIAGFLAALLHGLGPEQAAGAAVATGAFNVEAPDATSGIPPWDRVQARLDSRPARRAVRLKLAGWREDKKRGLRLSPRDAR
ncbi:MAG TPA: carbohydrate kinase family protein [Phycisphaerae bacterium]|nr:carbohydrate kinase family protein [Phycisphaerae bacterium]